ncbi:unnamed protein product [Heligmosomoides polygyrus]|uniref:Reverse transcriptase domain-containing protein n=1 Tax=Heligmosomoides polygyrus TaxID=6339 RepID=A0A183GTS1_HELPZ|nr:unnamed protein product [Heligmosomoides polygyrus]
MPTRSADKPWNEFAPALIGSRLSTEVVDKTQCQKLTAALVKEKKTFKGERSPSSKTRKPVKRSETRAMRYALPGSLSTSFSQIDERQDIPVGGRLAYFARNWLVLEIDKWAASVLAGYKIPFHSKCPPLAQREVNQGSSHPLLLGEIKKMLEKGAIEEIPWSEKVWLSSMFCIPKKDGSVRPIINLKPLNKFVALEHFKMESLTLVKDLVETGDYLVKIDMKEAYFSVPVCPGSRNYLSFCAEGRLYRFKALPFDLSSAPYVYTRLIKPVAGYLRKQGIRLVVYLDDWLFIGKSIDELKTHLSVALKLFHHLGLLANRDKSHLTPTQHLEFLGLEIDTSNLSFLVPPRKAVQIESEASALLDSSKEVLLRRVYDRCEPLPTACCADLRWFTEHFRSQATKPFFVSQPIITVCSDASNEGWGAVSGERRTGGRWSLEERSLHINAKEMLACLLGLQCFAGHLHNETVRVEMDNTSAVWYINKLGGVRSQSLNAVTRKVLLWAEERSLSVVACYRPGSQNTKADRLSREFKDSSEFSLDPIVVKSLFIRWGTPTIDLFASRNNAKCRTYFSILPDPHCQAVDAFKQPWSGIFAYAFPPFNLVGRTIRKALREHARLILVCPRWPTQAWWPLVQRYGRNPLTLPRSPSFCLGQEANLIRV